MCYCGNTQEFKDCCEPLIERKTHATNALNLMKSRYSAFVIKNMNYLLNTMDPQTKNDFDLKSNLEWANSVEFTGLKIVKFEENKNKAIVEFIASFTDLKSGQIYQHHELSQFRKQKERWYFRSGKTLS